MVGTRQFNEAKTLDAAMRVFWEKSYAATTIDDVVAATGVKRGSLYLAYGNKEGIFKAALQTYLNTINEAVFAPLAQGSLMEGLTHVYSAQVAGIPEFPPGCLIAQSAAELGARKDALGNATRTVLQNAERPLRERLEQAIAEGEVPSDFQIDRHVDFLAGLARSLPLTRKAAGETAARNVAQLSLEAFAGFIGEKPRPTTGK
ncbi:MAG: TetR/AcrR family transcriptional regulator [Pseudomonadota bacterium]